MEITVDTSKWNRINEMSQSEATNIHTYVYSLSSSGHGCFKSRHIICMNISWLSTQEGFVGVTKIGSANYIPYPSE